MKDCTSTLSIHEGMGTTQTGRVLPALSTDFFLIDERSPEDFILFVQKLSKFVKFYNIYNIPDGDWSALFERESTSILVYIAGWNLDYLINLYDVKKNEIAINASASEQKNILINYFNQIENEYNDLLKRANLLDNDIPEKENLLGTDYAIQQQFETVETLINETTDILSLLENYFYIRSTQQLFGLLTTWKEFSESSIKNQLENYDKHHPQYALFVAFLKLLTVARDQLNGVTKRHLDYYYKEVLKVQNQEASPDYVHLTLEPHKGVSPFLVPKDTIFLAGKNTAGQKKYFASTADQTINNIQLNSFCSHYCTDTILYKTTDLFANNATGNSFDVFTTTKETFKESFLIATPLLFLQSGERSIYLRFNDKDYDASKFNFYITGEKNLIEITDKITTKKDHSKTDNYIKLSIPSTEKAIVSYDAKIHAELLVNTTFPVLKIVPINRTVVTAIKEIDLEVKVEGFKSFVLQSDFGSINPEKPFYPFTELPKNGNGIVISSNEFFMKKNAQASFQITVDLPENKSIREEINNSRRTNVTEYNWINNKVKMYQLVDGFWQLVSNGLKTQSNDYPLTEYHFDEIITEEILSNGKFRIELNATKYEGETYMQNYIKASAEKTTLPYKPKVKEFVFNYSASEIINNSRKSMHNEAELFEVLPYGYYKKENKTIKFSELKNEEGYIYLGFENVSANDGLNFLIQLEEGTANPLLQPATINWCYLTNNNWTSFETNAVGDETFSLTQSGIVSITVPEFDASTNTKLPQDLFWVRIYVSNKQAICKFLGIHTQALKAVLTDYDNIGSVYTEQTPKETISKAFSTINNVKKIKQPYASFSGKKVEEDTNLYLRISERLRHKQRAITSWDYEHIVLQEFPEVYRAKILNHYKYDTKLSNVAAGYVTLIVVAKSSPSENINWKPLLSLNKMLKIKEYLKKISSPHVRINVKPPKPEKVELDFKVKFHQQEGMDSRLYIQQLMQTINEFLSPWAYDLGEVNFANTIEFSTLIQLIDNQTYVDYITDFKVTQYILDENYKPVGTPIKNLTKVTPQTDFTLFVPTETHKIKEI